MESIQLDEIGQRYEAADDEHQETVLNNCKWNCSLWYVIDHAILMVNVARFPVWEGFFFHPVIEINIKIDIFVTIFVTFVVH